MVKLGKNEDCKCLLCMGARGDMTSRPIKINRSVRNNENVISFNICNTCLETMKKEIDELDYYAD